MRPRIGLTTVFSLKDDPESISKYGLALNIDYIDAVRQAGGLPIPLPHCDTPDEVSQLLDTLDGVLFTGGMDIQPERFGQPTHTKTDAMDPRRDATEFELFAQAEQRRFPALGICLGIQLINVARGGTLLQHLPDAPGCTLQHQQKMTPDAHDLTIAANTRLADIIGAETISTNSRHHQAVDQLGCGLTATAHATDGVIEAIEDPDHPFLLAVQWHPENLADRAEHLALFRALVDAARNGQH